MAATSPVVLNSSAIVGKKEQLSDVIYALDPFETPIVNSIGKGSCQRISYDWQVDDFDNGDGSTTAGTTVGEGHEFTSQFGTFTDKINTVVQINERGFGITGTAEVEQKAGRSSELAFQMAKVAKKFKMDMEMQLAGAHRQKVFQETATVPRSTGGITNWLTKNVKQVKGITASNPSGYPSTGAASATASGYYNAGGTAITAAKLNVGTSAGDVTAFGANTGVNNGTGYWKEPTAAIADAPIKEEHLQDLLTDLYMQSGRSPNILVVDPMTKTRISNTFVGRAPTGTTATVNSQMTDRSVQSIVDVYVSDFGTLRITPSRFIGGDLENTGIAFALDTSMWSIDYLRPFSTYDLPKTGDYIRKAMNAEWGLRCNNANSSAMLTDFTRGNAIASNPVAPVIDPRIAVKTPDADSAPDAGGKKDSHNKVSGNPGVTPAAASVAKAK